MRVVFSLATCHLFDDENDFEFSLENVQDILMREYWLELQPYTLISYDEDGFRDEVIDWESFENENNKQLAQILIQLQKENKI